MNYLRFSLIVAFTLSTHQQLSTAHVNFDDDEKTKIGESLNAEMMWEQNYVQTLEFIKSHEGFNDGKPYLCAAGAHTIGYGHVILPNENFPGQITRQHADSILRNDFDKALAAVERNTDLVGAKKLAIAHFIFAVGVGNFNKSTLKKKILNNESVGDELLNWSYYTTPSGKKIRSNYAYKIRKWELEMYNK